MCSEREKRMNKRVNSSSYRAKREIKGREGGTYSSERKKSASGSRLSRNRNIPGVSLKLSSNSSAFFSLTGPTYQLNMTGEKGSIM